MQGRNVIECPADGCKTVQVMAKQLTDAVEQATECIEKTAVQHQSLLITLTRMETVLAAQTKQIEAVSGLLVDVAVLKNNAGISGTKTVGITSIVASIISGALIGIVEYVRTKG